MASFINIIFRVFQWFWSILIMALVGNMIAEAISGNPSVVNYVMFVSVFSVLSLFYLTPASISENFTIVPFGPVIVDALNVIFFFCGGVALAAKLRVHSCGNEGYTASNSITNGSYNRKKRCHEAQASTAFLWFGFAAYVGSLVFSVFASRGSTAPRPSIIRSRGGNAPAMSQV